MAVRLGGLGLPIIDNERMKFSSGYKKQKDSHLIINVIITTLVFLDILVIFTLFFNFFTKAKTPIFDYFIFFIWYNIFIFLLIPILVYMKTYNDL